MQRFAHSSIRPFVNSHISTFSHYLYPVHLLEDLGLLAADLEAHLEADLAEFRRDVLEGTATFREIDDHHHVEVVLHDRLRDVEDVDLGLGEIGAGLCENAHRVLADDGDDCLLLCLHVQSLKSGVEK